MMLFNIGNVKLPVMDRVFWSKNREWLQLNAFYEVSMLANQLKNSYIRIMKTIQKEPEPQYLEIFDKIQDPFATIDKPMEQLYDLKRYMSKLVPSDSLEGYILKYMNFRI